MEQKIPSEERWNFPFHFPILKLSPGAYLMVSVKDKGFASEITVIHIIEDILTFMSKQASQGMLEIRQTVISPLKVLTTLVSL